ncbi:Serine/threonine-protein kinase csk1 [Beauveria bassiana]|nr:Serine/threonine-protein kinase csk1 [Beauveria bassiana]
MAITHHDWHSTVSATDRYGTVRSIQEALPDGSMSTAMAIEQAAYTDSASRIPTGPVPSHTHSLRSKDDYTAACQAAIAASAPASVAAAAAGDASSAPGDTRIGPFSNCTPIADGVTSTVYRSADGATALKVITVHHPLPPHDPQREIRILRLLRPPCIPLLSTFRDQSHQQVLAFPYKPLTLDALLLSAAPHGAPLPRTHIKAIFADVVRALAHIHELGIIHRDVKPSAVLLDAPGGPAHLSDFGTAWHPTLSAAAEPAAAKILDIGTGPYRAPEVLFVNKAYGTEVDVWALGVMLAECVSTPARPPFESRAVSEDGNQLGLILSIFKTMGTPTPETWPEAREFQVSPFEMWTVFPQRSWREILPDVESDWLEMIESTVRFSKRATAKEVRPYATDLTSHEQYANTVQLLQYKCIE